MGGGCWLWLYFCGGQGLWRKISCAFRDTLGWNNESCLGRAERWLLEIMDISGIRVHDAVLDDSHGEGGSAQPQSVIHKLSEGAVILLLQQHLAFVFTVSVGSSVIYIMVSRRVKTQNYKNRYFESKGEYPQEKLHKLLS